MAILLEKKSKKHFRLLSEIKEKIPERDKKRPRCAASLILFYGDSYSSRRLITLEFFWSPLDALQQSWERGRLDV